MNEELEVLASVTRKLNQAKIQYMITGSIAMNYYATPRMTRDIDIVIELQQVNLKNFIDLFSEDYYIFPETVQRAIKYRELFNIIHNEYALKLDFIVKKNNPYRHTEFSRRKCISLEGIPLYIATPEDLILSKLYWAKDSFSALQITDIQNLFHEVSDLDNHYIEKWITELNLEEIYMKVKYE